MHAGAGGVERELAHRDAHAQRAEVAEAEDALAVGHDNHAHIGDGPVAQNLADATAVLDREVEAARPAEDRSVLETGLADRGRVDDRDHLLGKLLQQAVEQGFVAVLEGGQENVFLQRIALASVISHDALDLLFDRERAGRQQAAQAERVALALGERGALVEERGGEERGSPGKQGAALGEQTGGGRFCRHMFGT